MSPLKFARNLELPSDAVTQSIAFLGRKGSGKSYASSKLAELMLDIGAQIVVLDPVGIWYGLRLNPAKTGPSGYDIPVLGGLHGDIPLEATAGALIADLVVDRGISVVLDVSQFESDADKARFAEAFGARFFFRQKQRPSAVHLFLEECQEFVPQNPQRGEERMLHVYTRTMKIGRNFGIGMSLISQRPQEVNKKVLNMCELLLAFQATGIQERQVIEKWAVDRGVDEDAESLSKRLPFLEVGTAHAWSPQWLQIAEDIHILKKKTADVSSTPKVGDAPIEAKPLGAIDLEQLQKAMATQIEKAKAEDPKELHKTITRLERELRETKTGNGNGKAHSDPAEISRAVNAAIANVAQRYSREFERRRSVVNTSLVGLSGNLRTIADRLHEAAIEFAKPIDEPDIAPLASSTAVVHDAPRSPRTSTAVAAAPAPKTRDGFIPQSTPRGGESASDIGRTPQRMLGALRFYESLGISPITRSRVAGFVGISADTGTFRNYLSQLRKAGYIIDALDDMVALNAAGRAVATDEGLPQSRAELHRMWLAKLGTTPAKMLQLLIDTYPDSMSRPALARMCNIDHTTGTFRNYLSQLRVLGLIIDQGDDVKASEDALFPRGLH
jgi:uncharacterized protein